jgi:hypothetical protein
MKNPDRIHACATGFAGQRSGETGSNGQQHVLPPGKMPATTRCDPFGIKFTNGQQTTVVSLRSTTDDLDWSSVWRKPWLINDGGVTLVEEGGAIRDLRLQLARIGNFLTIGPETR